MMEKEVESTFIGELVMDKLRGLDKISPMSDLLRFTGSLQI